MLTYLSKTSNKCSLMEGVSLMTTNMDCSFVRENSPCGSVGTESLVQRLVCGYPIHKGKNKQILNPRRINMTTSHEIFKMHGVIVPAGTCKNSRFCIIQIRFDCQPFCNGFFFFTSLELTANCIKYSYTISKKGLISYNVGEGEGEGGKYCSLRNQ